MTTSPQIDVLDAKLIALLTTEPRLGVMEYSRRLGVARGTIQARLDKLRERGVVTGFGPDVDPEALGYDVTAFVTLELRQDNGHRSVSAELSKIPYVLEAHTVSGSGDMMCRVVARTNADLQHVIDQVVSTPGVQRASSVIALAERIPYRTLPLVAATAAPKRVPNQGQLGVLGPASGAADGPRARTGRARGMRGRGPKQRSLIEAVRAVGGGRGTSGAAPARRRRKGRPGVSTPRRPLAKEPRVCPSADDAAGADPGSRSLYFRAMFSACRPLGLRAMSNSTFWPSSSSLTEGSPTLETCAKTSSPPSSCAMKP